MSLPPRPMARSRGRLAATAHPQSASPFFDRLPTEIRRKIYEELWALHATRWHVHSLRGQQPAGVPGPVFPCATMPDDEDIRYSRFQAPLSEDIAIWESRLRSPWNAHWKCAEAAAAQRRRRRESWSVPMDPISFRPLMLSDPLVVCKQMYLEMIVPLEETLTVCFTDIIVARDFLARTTYRRRIQNIELSLRLKPIITELYHPGADGEPEPHIGGLAITAKNNPWEELCRYLATMPTLRQLHLRFDSEDLRPWHQRVNEKKFFEQLCQVQARKMTVDLPTIPGAPEAQGLPGCYLEEGCALERAPFEVRRSPRPNNWQLHLSRISHVLPENWSHTLWNQVRDKMWAA